MHSGLKGSDFIPTLLANGNQTSSNSNRYSNFEFTDGAVYNQVKLISDSLAFESDNHNFGTIAAPESCTLALLGPGLAGFGAHVVAKLPDSA